MSVAEIAAEVGAILPKALSEIVARYAHQLQGVVVHEQQSVSHLLVAHDDKLYEAYRNRVFDFFKGYQDLYFPPCLYTSTIRSLAAVPGGVASGSINGTVCIWNSAATRVVRSWKAHDQLIVALAANNNMLAVCCVNIVSVWILETDEQVWMVHTDGAVTTLAFLSSQRVAVGFDSGRIQIFDIRSQRCVAIDAHKMAVRAVVGLHIGTFVSAAPDAWVHVWTPSGDHVHAIQLDSSVLALALLPDGRFVTGCDNNSVRVWDPRTFECVQTLSTGPVGLYISTRDFCLVVMQNGNLVVANGSSLLIYK
jgi:WD40 repeat protein